MPAPARTRLAAEITERQVPAGGFVVRKGAPVEAWIGVVDGLVKIATETRGGKTISFAGMPTGAWFGEGSVLKDAVWRYDAIALRPSRIAFMPRATFLRLLDTDIAFNRFLLEQLNERLGQFIGQVEHDRLLPPEARVARCLAALANPKLFPVVGASFAISQEELGYLGGLARQTVNRALRAAGGRATGACRLRPRPHPGSRRTPRLRGLNRPGVPLRPRGRRPSRSASIAGAARSPRGRRPSRSD